MTSSLTWVDYDSEARDRSLRILAWFQQKESRDELGLGGIRDSFADMLFPGTSTIQTRLKYMLFVPWLYKLLEARKISSKEFSERAAQLELNLVNSLLNSGDTSGVFGKLAGSKLKRLPSSVYWVGLRSWGIRVLDTSQDQFHNQIDEVYRRRASQSAHSKDNAQSGDVIDEIPDPGTLTWHPNLPTSPSNFPDQADFVLTKNEAQFIQERITLSHPDSLFSWLAREGTKVEISAPWRHPNFAYMSDRHKEILEHARKTSLVMHGASLLYNVLLARQRAWIEREDQYSNYFKKWSQEIEDTDLTTWALDELWELTIDDDHRITRATRAFVESWVSMIRADSYGMLNSVSSNELIKSRETTLKKSQSRFLNRDALQQWGGGSGLGRLNYRWPTTQTFLNDLYQGLSA